MKVFVVQLYGSDENGFPRFEFLSPQEYYCFCEKGDTHFQSVAEFFMHEKDFHIWKVSFCNSAERDSLPNRSQEDILADDKLSNMDRQLMERLETEYLQDTKRHFAGLCSLVSDNDLYKRACDLAEVWSACVFVPHGRDLENFLKKLQVCAGNGPNDLIQCLQRETERAEQCEGANKRAALCDVLDRLKAVLYTLPRHYPSLFPVEEPQELWTLCLTYLQKDFIQHFSAHLLYVRSLYLDEKMRGRK
jgi:hypothetical protein